MARNAHRSAGKNPPRQEASQHASSPHHEPQSWFTWFAHETARLTGKPAAFLTAFTLIVVWGATGPVFHYSDTWQLVVNTATTIVTFLMVFLIQNTQNRDSLAFQIKLAELIVAMHGAKNNLATVEDMCDEDLETLHKEYRKLADETLGHLERRGAKPARH